MSNKKLEIKLNWYDRTVGFFSPKALLARKKARVLNAHFERKYEGADSGRRTGGWNTNSLSANGEIASAGFRLRDRARDLVRNNPYAARSVEVIANNVVGKGILTQIKVDMSPTVSAQEKKINNIWQAWAQHCDFDGVNDFAGMQRMVMRAVAESGEIIVRVRRTGRRRVMAPDGKVVEIPPFQLQLLESDFIANDSIARVTSKVPEGHVVIEGIELDRSGKRVAYHLHKSHPGNISLDIASNFDTIRVPAGEILHCYRQDRPGQLRGVTFLHPIILRLRDFDLYEDAQLKRQQCAAMYTAFVTDIDGVDDAAVKEQEAELGEKMEPGIIELLPPGKDIKLSDPPGADNYKEYTSVVLHSIASGIGITFEQLTGDLSEQSFSSARMGWIEAHRNFDTWRHNIMERQFLNPVSSWFFQGLELIGESAKDARSVFTAPRREMIDPVKETQAMIKAIRGGLKTQSEAVRELGKDPEAHFAEYAQDNKTLDDKGLIFDSDARKRTIAGSSNEEDDGGDGSENPPPKEGA